MASFQRPIAVTGIACRFPGGASDAEKFWSLLSAGYDAWSDVPQERYNWKAFHQSDQTASGNGVFNHRGGHFLDEDVSRFDAGFFGISPQEAQAMDPQQRLLLEVAYEAFENAGLKLNEIAGSKTAVYVASFNGDYELLMHTDKTNLPNYLATGTGRSMLSNRISYTFDLKGPSMTIDTGCSGSLVALHQACQSLRTGEADIALVGGANLILDPSVMIPMTKIGLLNSEGRSYPFDDRGHGYGRGEGVAAVILRRYETSQTTPARAIIRSTAVGQDGKTEGITLPSSDAQLGLIRSAYEVAGLHPQQTSYVEAHGTGTVAGDRAELQAIQNAFRQPRGSTFVGSVKANIGHLESASGLAGLIKTILMLEKGQVPGNPKLKRLKDDLLQDKQGLHINRELIDWPKDAARRASINSFGYGGTNAHAIVETTACYESSLHSRPAIRGLNGHLHMPTTTTSKEDKDDQLQEPRKSKTLKRDLVNGLVAAAEGLTNGTTEYSNPVGHKLSSDHTPSGSSMPNPIICFLSAKSQTSLQASMASIADFAMRNITDLQGLNELAYEVSCRRSFFPWRKAIAATSMDDFTSQLLKDTPKLRRAPHEAVLDLIFTGQGAQVNGMGRELLVSSSIFKLSVERSGKFLLIFGANWSLVDELAKSADSSRMEDSEISQPATTAIQIALVDLLNAAKIKITTVVGHSSGEIAAAYAAGALSHKGAMQVSYQRGHLARAARDILKREGAMIAIGLTESVVADLLRQISHGRANLACVNSPASCTVSGDQIAIEDLQQLLETMQPKPFFRKLNVDTAYHSHHMEAIADIYVGSLRTLESRPVQSSIKFISSVTGKEKTSGFDASYWAENLVSPVLFHQALGTLFNNKFVETATTHCIVEVGPHAALKGPIKQCLDSIDAGGMKYVYSSLLLREEDAYATLLRSLSVLFENGLDFDLSEGYFDVDSSSKPSWLAQMPPYAWDHTTAYWHASHLERDLRHRQFAPHELLGQRIAGSPSLEPSWRIHLDAEHPSWLKSHQIGGQIILPPAAYLCAAIEAHRQISYENESHEDGFRFEISDVSFSDELILPQLPTNVELYTSLRPCDPSRQGYLGWSEFRIFSCINTATESEPWVCQSHGRIRSHHFKYSSVSGPDKSSKTSSKPDDELTSSQTRQVPKRSALQDVYGDTPQCGDYYNGDFAIVNDLKALDSKISGNLTLNRDPAIHSIFDHCEISPSILDLLLHSCVPLHMQSFGKSPVMARGVDCLSITQCAGINGLTFSGSLSSVRPRSTISDITAFSNESGAEKRELIAMSGVQLRSLEAYSAKDEKRLSKQGITYRLEWGLHCDLGVNQVFQSMTRKPALSPVDPQETIRALNEECLFVVKEFLSAYRSRPNIPTHYQRLLAWMQKYSESNSALKQQFGPEASTPARNQHCGPMADMFFRLAGRLQSIYEGKVEPLSIMLEGNLLYRTYDDEILLRSYHNLNQYMESFIFTYGQISALEIGAGTGSTTKSLMSHLSQGSQSQAFGVYDYTDVSSGFFSHAQQVLKSWDDIIKYRTLDIWHDPAGQGFDAHVYDLVIASNVLHLTSPVEVGLRNARQLLKPGGKLLLLECTKLQPYMNIIFGVLEGWWAGSYSAMTGELSNLGLGARDGRVDSPLLTREQWDIVLRNSGFSGVDAYIDDHQGPEQAYTMMVSTAIEVTDQKENVFEVIKGGNTNPETDNLASECLTSLRRQNHHASIQTWPTKILYTTCYVLIDHYMNPLALSKSKQDFSNLIQLLTRAAKVIWISTSQIANVLSMAERGVSIGLTRTARAENQNLRLMHIQLVDTSLGAIPTLICNLIEKFTTLCKDKPSSSPIDWEYIYRHPSLLVPRLIRDIGSDRRLLELYNGPELTSTAFKSCDQRLVLTTQRALGNCNVEFSKADELSVPSSEVEIAVETWGISRGDLAVYHSVTREQPAFNEFAGIVLQAGFACGDRYDRGTRICAWGATPCANRIKVDSLNCCPLPASWSFVDGACVPVAIGTAYRALKTMSCIEHGQSLLVHGVKSRVGRAAIKLALKLSAAVVAIVEDDTLVQDLMQLGLHERDVIVSSAVFDNRAREILRDGAFDVVINCVPNGLVDVSMWLADFGTFIDIKNSNAFISRSRNTPLRASNATYVSLDFPSLAAKYPTKASNAIRQGIALLGAERPNGISILASGSFTDIGAVSNQTSPDGDMDFIVLESRDDTLVKVKGNHSLRFVPSSEATYVIAGGLGGLGLATCHHLASRGAKDIALLTRRELKPSEQEEIFQQLNLANTKVHIFKCDVGDDVQVDQAFNAIKTELPPIRGVFHAALVLKDQSIERLTLENLQEVLHPKVKGTCNLLKAVQNEPLEFFAIYSSAVGVIGSPGQANYAAATAFQDLLATDMGIAPFPIISLCPGPTEGTGRAIQDPKYQRNLLHQGLALVNSGDWFAVLDGILDKDRNSSHSRQVVLGLDSNALRNSGNQNLIRNRMFQNVLHHDADRAISEKKDVIETPISVLEAAATLEEARDFISSMIAQKLSDFIALNGEDVDTSMPISEFGFDSLHMIELRNWIGATLSADLETQEIQQASSTLALSKVVADRSRLLHFQKAAGLKGDDESALENHTEVSTIATVDSSLPTQPVPDLKDALEICATLAPLLLSNEKLNKTKQTISKMLLPGCNVETAYNHLVERHKMLDKVNWVSDLYAQNLSLRRRTPLTPFHNFFWTHPDMQNQHGQAERAALVSTAMLDFRKRLRQGLIKPTNLAGEVQSMAMFHTMFDTCLIPGLDEDRVETFGECNHIVVLCRGHVFMVDIPQDTASSEELEAIFLRILKTAGSNGHDIGILTADYRDAWANTRNELITVDSENKSSFQAIETASFVICLDDSAPKGSSERAQHFMWGSATNRWNDKSLQLVVCANGASGLICQHATMDAQTIRPLYDATVASIRKHSQVALSSNGDLAEVATTMLPFTLSNSIKAHILQAKNEFASRIAKCSFDRVDNQDLSTTFLSDRRASPRSSTILALLLAQRLFFGYTPVSAETVTLSHFRAGRIEITPLLTPDAKQFCEVAASTKIAETKTDRDADHTVSTEDSKKSETKALLHSAIRAHNRDLARVRSGHGFVNLLFALQWLIREDTKEDPEAVEEPEFFQTELWKEISESKVTISSVDAGIELPETGIVNSMPGSCWVYFEVGEKGAKIMLWGHEFDTERFKGCVERALKIVRGVLE